MALHYVGMGRCNTGKHLDYRVAEGPIGTGQGELVAQFEAGGRQT